MQDRDQRPEDPSKRGRLVSVAAIVLLCYVCTLPVVFSSRIINGRAAADHLNYHEPVIHNFARDWPTPDLSNYHSATTPLYHLILAGAEVAFEPSRRGFMLLAGLYTVGLFALLTWSLPVRTTLRLALVLPMLGSMYVLFPGIWLLPDNAGWLGVLVVLLIALRVRSLPVMLFGSGLVLLLLVLTRQIHMWAAGIIWAAAWLGPTDAPPPEVDTPVHPMVQIAGLFKSPGPRLVRLIPAVLITLPAFAAIAYFFSLWHGLVVPRYQQGSHGGYHGWNPATAAFHLSIIGSVAPFYAGFAWNGLRRLLRSPGWLVGVVLLALVLTAIPLTSYDASVGRKSGLWNAVKVVPLIAGHSSPVLLILAPLGALMVASLLAQLRVRSAWIFLAAIVAFVAAQTASPQLWQRYHEPFILMMLALMSAAAISNEKHEAPTGLRIWRLVGPVILSLGLGALSVWTIATDKPAVSLETGDFQKSVDYEPLHPGRAGPTRDSDGK